MFCFFDRLKRFWLEIVGVWSPLVNLNVYPLPAHALYSILFAQGVAILDQCDLPWHVEAKFAGTLSITVASQITIADKTLAVILF